MLIPLTLVGIDVFILKRNLCYIRKFLLNCMYYIKQS